MSRVAALVLGVALAGCGPSSPGAPDTCAVSFSDQGQVRVFAVTHRFSLDDARTYQAYEASWLRHLDAIRPCLSPDRPNLVTFPEDAGLIAWFIGRQALLGRSAATTGDAFNAIYAQAWRQADEYRRRFPGISAARALTLALSDRAWRAVEGSFSRFARESGAWVVTSANLPVSERITGTQEAVFFGDPEVDGSAWVARDPALFNTGLLYDPSGERVGRVDKVYLVPAENEDLDLSNGALASLDVLRLPFGRVGVAISRDAFYPPFQQRLDDLRADLVVQPEAFSGWAREQLAGDWLPDVYLASGWALNQKYGAIRHTVGPVLTGNLFESDFDGQAQITGHADGREGGFFVGQEPVPGLEVVGEWAYVEDLSQPVPERRANARAAGKKLLPGGAHAGRYHDGFIAADLALPGDGPSPPVAVTEEVGKESVAVDGTGQGHQRNASAAFDVGGRLYVAWEDGRGSQPQIRFAVSNDEGATFGPSVLVGPSARPQAGPQTRPHVAAQGGGRVAIAWQEGAPGAEQVRVAVSTNAGAGFAVRTVEPTWAAQWEPQVAFDDDGVLWVAWTDFRRGAAPEVRLARRIAASGPYLASCPVDSTTEGLARLRPSQLQPALATLGPRVAVAWIDYRGEDWQVYARVDPDPCFAEGPATRLGPTSTAEVLAADPAWATAPDGRLLVVWDEIRDRRGIHDVRAAQWQQGTWTGFDPPDRSGMPRYRPSPVFEDGAWRIFVQDNAPRRSVLGRLDVAALGRFDPPVRVDGTGAAPLSILRPRAAARVNGAGGVVLYEDARDGWVRVRAQRF